MVSPSYDINTVKHLDLAVRLCNIIGLDEPIDKLLPEQSGHKNITYNQLVAAMILNGQEFTGRTFNVYPAYFLDMPLERLLGPNIETKCISINKLLIIKIL